MDIQKLTIGQMAELNQVTRQTLRHYEAEGLLIPYHTDPESGYRYYHINQSAKLDMIQYLKFCGMSLQQIKAKFASASVEEIQSFLVAQLDYIDESMHRLSQSRHTIARTIENYKRYKLLPQNQTIFHEIIPERKLYVHTSSVNYFDANDSGYEMMLRELKCSLVNKKLPTNYFCNIGTIIRKPHVEKRELYANEVFMFVDEDYEVHHSLETIPEGMYVCICAEDFYKEEEFAQRLFDYIDNNNYMIVGDYICEVIAEFPMYEQTPRSMLYKIQIPIQSKA
ncbi:MAG: MerR family transcriptional regulator [Eubacteriales bacterium]|nr:MerR family transcriptional regulator [Eubacteriales bacterium]